MTEVRESTQPTVEQLGGKTPPSVGGGLRERRGSALPTTSRSYGQMIGALALVVGAALIGALLLTQAGDASSVLAVRGQVAKGQIIERGDLVSTQVAGVTGAVPAEDAASVVGKTAAVDLVPDQVITRRQVIDREVPGPGHVLVGLALKPAQMPGTGLAAGDLVKVLAVPTNEAAGAAELPDARVLASSARVYSVTGGNPQAGGGTGRVVTVVAPADSSEQLSAYASTGRVAIMKIPAGGS